ncbi:MAG: hypothetical protein K2N95_02710 [Lachnospiraceae bacterium]|nr:hypothetical protein [Lachnospiraceae bacterium]
MTAEEVFCDLSEKYGDSFHWRMLPLSNKSFVNELKREIGQSHFLYNRKIWAVAKCDSRDDVLFVTVNDDREDVYYIFHLTYSDDNAIGYPQYKELNGVVKMKEYIEERYLADFL